MTLRSITGFAMVTREDVSSEKQTLTTRFCTRTKRVVFVTVTEHAVLDCGHMVPRSQVGERRRMKDRKSVV